MRDGDEDAALVFVPKGDGSFTARLYTSNTSATQAGIIKGIVFGAADRVSIAATGGPPALRFQAVSVDSASLSYIDFLLPGIVALSIMISAVIGLATVLVDWRQRGILRRLKLTPIPLAEFFAARIAASLVVAIMQVVVLLAFGRFVFGIHISSTWPGRRSRSRSPAACASSQWDSPSGRSSRTPRPATRSRTSITNPMMFLSGVFFPVAAMPAFVQSIARVLPLYYLANGLRDTTVRGLSLTHVAGDIGVLLAATAVLAAVSLRMFRWEPST